MKITIVGGGPAGLYFAILMKRLDAAHEIAVLERDGPDDTFGWGIVFSDQTFGDLKDHDEPTYRAITESCERWDNVDVVHRGRKITIRGNRFSGVQRLRFLNTLHARCRELGVDLRFHTRVTEEDCSPGGIASRSRLAPAAGAPLASGLRPPAPGLLDCDLLVGADGANSTVRRAYADAFQPALEAGRNKYVWLGTHHLFHGLTLTFREGEAGVFAAHSYKFSPTTSTFIVECSEDTWARAGLDRMTGPETCAYLARVFADDLGGEPLLSNDFVKWLNFLLVKNARWRHRHVVLLGDSLHTAHFSIGSGTKLALEDAIALCESFKAERDVDRALEAFERDRKPVIESYQEAASESRVWFEEMARYMRLEPLELAYAIMTRSKKIDREKLRQRDPGFVAAYERLRPSPGV